MRGMGQDNDPPSRLYILEQLKRLVKNDLLFNAPKSEDMKIHLGFPTLMQSGFYPGACYNASLLGNGQEAGK